MKIYVLTWADGTMTKVYARGWNAAVRQAAEQAGDPGMKRRVPLHIDLVDPMDTSTVVRRTFSKDQSGAQARNKVV